MARDVMKAPPLILAGKTSAAQPPSTELGARRPAIRYRLDGYGRDSGDQRVKTRRIVFDCYGTPGVAGHAQANLLQLEIEDALIPPASPVHGFRGGAGDVWVDNVEHDFGPTWAPDPETGEARYVVGYLFTYY